MIILPSSLFNSERQSIAAAFTSTLSHDCVYMCVSMYVWYVWYVRVCVCVV